MTLIGHALTGLALSVPSLPLLSLRGDATHVDANHVFHPVRPHQAHGKDKCAIYIRKGLFVDSRRIRGIIIIHGI